MLLFHLDGADYQFDPNTLDLDEAKTIKKVSGLTVRRFQEGMQDLDADALQAMVWLTKTRAGEAVRFADIKFDIIPLISSFRQEVPPGEPGDPPVGQPTTAGSDNGTTPSDAEPNTSPTSPTTSD